MKTITISRQLGSGGAYIGQLLATRLGFKYVDREVLHLAAQEFGCETEDLAARAERISSFWTRILGGLALGSPERRYTPPPLRDFSDRELFEKQTEILKRIAARHDCVIIGWGGVGILPRHAELLSIFCHAPASFRIKRSVELGYAPDAEAARRLIEESDAMRQRYFTAMTGHDWNCAEYYDLSLNTCLQPLEASVELILHLFEQKLARRKSACN